MTVHSLHNYWTDPKMTLENYNEQALVVYEQETTDFGLIRSVKIVGSKEHTQKLRILSELSECQFMQDLNAEFAYWLEAEGERPPKGVLHLQHYQERLGLGHHIPSLSLAACCNVQGPISNSFEELPD